MNKNPFSEVETLKRRVKDLNRELFHTRNLAENLREENKHLTEMNQRYKGKLQEQQDQIAELKQKSQCIRNLVEQKNKAEDKLHSIALAAQKKLGTFGAALRFKDEVKDILKGGGT